MRMKLWMACLVTGLAVATTVEAQPGGGGRGGGFGGRGGIFSTATNEAVQKELSLSTDDAAKVKTVSDEYNAAMREAMGAGGPPGSFRDMSPEERTKLMEKMNETRKETTAKFLPNLKAALTADQFTRLQQINWQSQGTGSYSDSEVVKALTITKDQTDKIGKISEEYAAKTRELFQPGGGGGGGGFEKMQELNKERDGKINEVLTKDQLDKFATLKGKEFDVSLLRRGGPGGPGGQGGGQGGGGGGAGARPKRPQPKSE